MDDIAGAVRQFFEEYGLPLALGGHAASVLAKNSADKKANANANRLAEAEMARQAQAQAESRAKFQSVMPQFNPGNQEANRAAEQTRLAGIIQAPGEASGVTQNYQQARASEPKVVGDTIAGAVGDALGRSRQHATNSALARSFGAADFGNKVALNSAGRDINRINRDAEASRSILPIELAEAGQKGQGLRTLADAFGVFGDVAGNMRFRKPAPKATGFGSTERNF